jgi:hypothetical protein
MFYLVQLINTLLNLLEMCLQQMQILFNVGKLFALSPSTVDVKSITHLQKIWAMLMLSTLTIWMFNCISYKNFYTPYIHIKMIICLLTDIALLSIYVTAVTDVTFRKRDHWFKLMKNLKLIHLCDNSVRSMKNYTTFLVGNGIYIVVMGFTTFSWYELQGVRYFREFSCTMILMYAKYLQKLILYVILKMIAGKYHSLSQQLRSLTAKSKTQRIVVVLRRIKYFIEVLKDTVNIFNGMFGWLITLILTFTFLHLLNYLDYLFITISNLDEMFIVKCIIADIMNLVFDFVSDLYNLLHQT